MKQRFRTELFVKEHNFKISHADALVSVGSCFSNHLSEKLQNYKFKVFNQPYGILYSPVVIAQNLLRSLDSFRDFKPYLVQNESIWYSFLHHGSIADTDQNALLEKIQKRENQLRALLQKSKLLILTFGSSYTFFLKKGNFAVANCHKIPASEFERKRIEHSKIIALFRKVFQKLKAHNPELKVLLTVSPIRHLKDGFHENQLSKAHLHLACDALVKEFEQAHYFPSYELLLDDLRDYRFYAEDMIHPSEQAINYIWNKWQAAYVDEKSQSHFKSIDQVQKGLAHRPIHFQREGEEKRKAQLKKQMLNLEEIVPGIDFSEEKARLDII